MKRRRFIGSTALLSSATLFFKQSVSASTTILPTQFVAIGNGACKVMDEVKILSPQLTIIRAPGVDYDFEQSTLLGLPILKGQPVRNVLQPVIEGNNPLVVLYCLGGKSNITGALDFFNHLKEKERRFKLVVQFPFDFEGKNRSKIAIETANKISSVSSCVSFNASYLYSKLFDLKGNYELLNTKMISLILEEQN